MKYGYNFPADIISLDRDRKVLPAFNTLQATSDVWRLTDSDLIIPLLEESCADVHYIDWGYIRAAKTSVGEKSYNSFKEKYGEASYPVTNQSEMEALAKISPELKPIIVPESYKSFLVKTSLLPDISSDVKHATSLKGRLEILRDEIQDKLTTEELQELNDIISKMWS